MAATEAGAPATETADGTPALRDRLVSALPADRVLGWIGPLLVTAFGAFLRFNRLAVPRALIFDETYYAKDAYSFLNYGVEHNLVSNANALIQSGSTKIFSPGAEYVVHPPLGKWLIAGGEWLFGLNSFGWRFSAAVFGSLAILLICRIARRMTRLTLLGCIAGLLMSLDGLEFVMSRTGLLDIFLMFFVLASFGCLVIDRDVSRARLAQAVAARGTSGAGPGIGIHWWRVAAGFFIGCACACKQDAVLVPLRVRRPGPRVGRRGAARGGNRPLLARCAGPRREMAAAHLRSAAAGRVHRLVERLVRVLPRL